MKFNKKFRDSEEEEFDKIFEGKNSKKKNKRVKWYENADPDDEENNDLDLIDDREQ